VACLEKDISLLEKAGCKVALVTFGTPKAAKVWLSEIGSNLEMYVDKDRVLYKMLGQGRSTSMVYNIDTVKYVAIMNIHGKELLPLIEDDIHDDLQMGGNITIKCASSKVKMAYPSKGAIDRPSIHQILQKLS